MLFEKFLALSTGVPFLNALLALLGESKLPKFDIALDLNEFSISNILQFKNFLEKVKFFNVDNGWLWDKFCFGFEPKIEKSSLYFQNKLQGGWEKIITECKSLEDLHLSLETPCYEDFKCPNTLKNLHIVYWENNSIIPNIIKASEEMKSLDSFKLQIFGL